MEWIFFTGAVVFMALKRWGKKNLKLFPFLLEVLVFGVFVFLFTFALHYFTWKTPFAFPLSNYIPETVQLWIGAIFFFAVVCAFSIKGWRTFNAEKNEKHGNG